MCKALKLHLVFVTLINCLIINLFCVWWASTRAVQKLIETLKTSQQVAMVISSLKPGVVTLIKDLNGNHVVQRCLQCLVNEDSQVKSLCSLYDA